MKLCFVGISLFSLGLLAAAAPIAPGSALAAESVSIDAGRRSADMIHRLGSDARQLRFEGETASKTWTLYVTAAQAQTRARIHLSFANAISVMPEVSNLSVSVNDVAVGQTAIDAGNDPGALDVELPRGVLTEGYNSLRVSVAQRHRVDCSLEATYELWTQLDPASSGLTFPGLTDWAINSLDDLAAISPEASGAVTIHAVLADNADPAAVDRVMRAIEAVAIRAAIARPNVEIVDAIDQRPGLWVLAGTKSDLRARGLENYLPESDAPALVSADGSGREIVVAAGADAAATDAAITALLPSRRAADFAATPSTARALMGVNGFPVAGGTRLPLHDLGVQTEEFDGRLFRAGLDILLPPDFYPADYDKLTLSISAGYSAGLLPGSQILVRVNDLEAGSLPMRNPRGDLYHDRPISISLAALRPGVNHLLIEAQTPMAEDASCEVRAMLNAKKRFVLFDRSELIMPRIARIARMPNLAATMSSGFPYQQAARAWIFLAKRDRGTIAAAATFLARSAFVAQQLLNARPTFDRKDLVDGSVLFFGAMGDFNPGMFDEFGIDYHSLREAWTRPSLPEGSAPEKPKTKEAAAARGDVYDQWAGGDHETPGRFGIDFSWRALYDRYINVHSEEFAFLRSPAEKITLPDTSTLLIAQAHSPKEGLDTWTLVVAANASTLTRDIGGLVAPSNWNKIDGRAAVFGPKTGVEVFSRSANNYFIPTQALTPSNLRLVAAGYLSSNIDYYVIAMAIASLILGIVTYAAARAHGVRQ